MSLCRRSKSNERRKAQTHDTDKQLNKISVEDTGTDIYRSNERGGVNATCCDTT